MNIRNLNLYNKINRIEYFTNNDIEIDYSFTKADRYILVIKGKREQFNDIEEFVFRAYIKDDLDELKSLNKTKLLNLINSDFLLESDKSIELKAIKKDEIKNLFINHILKSLDIRIDKIEFIYWIENDYMDQSLIFSTQKYLYFIQKSVG